MTTLIVIGSVVGVILIIFVLGCSWCQQVQEGWPSPSIHYHR